jgi:predicted O-methyltransferase YrrM
LSTDQAIRFAYHRYVTSVSHPAHAISLQLAYQLWELLATGQPRTAADFGSGFSSFVLRLYAERCNREMQVWSVDDDAGWLAKTRQFLEEEGLSTQRLVPWDDFEDAELQFALHDLGSMETREATLSRVLSMIAPDGAIVLDDLQFGYYRAHVERTLKSHGFDYTSLEPTTADLIGRYSWLARPSDH